MKKVIKSLIAGVMLNLSITTNASADLEKLSDYKELYPDGEIVLMCQRYSNIIIIDGKEIANEKRVSDNMFIIIKTNNNIFTYDLIFKIDEKFISMYRQGWLYDSYIENGHIYIIQSRDEANIMAYTINTKLNKYINIGHLYHKEGIDESIGMSVITSGKCY